MHIRLFIVITSLYISILNNCYLKNHQKEYVLLDCLLLRGHSKNYDQWVGGGSAQKKQNNLNCTGVTQRYVYPACETYFIN